MSDRFRLKVDALADAVIRTHTNGAGHAVDVVEGTVQASLKHRADVHEAFCMKGQHHVNGGVRDAVIFHVETNEHVVFGRFSNQGPDVLQTDRFIDQKAECCGFDGQVGVEAMLQNLGHHATVFLEEVGGLVERRDFLAKHVDGEARTLLGQPMHDADGVIECRTSDITARDVPHKPSGHHPGHGHDGP